MSESVMALGALVVLAGARVLYRWIGSRARVKLARVHQQGTSERVRLLPPGSVLEETRADGRLRVEVGGEGRSARVVGKEGRSARAQ
ncbi:hypothetical protein [Streptomyces sp. NPDC051218]|uniref:hypothetical protein n=1 Tax=Streptomyces sp. NPDC051218 TaxID=3365645 RepID=UPI0037A21B58